MLTDPGEVIRLMVIHRARIISDQFNNSGWQLIMNDGHPIHGDSYVSDGVVRVMEGVRQIVAFGPSEHTPGPYPCIIYHHHSDVPRSMGGTGREANGRYLGEEDDDAT